ncbi:sulfatase-like hydrolase/transferase [bacterium]|nr:sulfatase-like hydrolase/transferase [bacterium]
MIARMDADIGRILDTLVQQGLDQETIVFFSSDNGPHHESHCDPDFFKSSGPFRGIKRDLYEGGIRVPMLVRWPEKIAPREGIQPPLGFLGYASHLVRELAGAACPHGIDGQSIVPALFGGDALSIRFSTGSSMKKGFNRLCGWGHGKLSGRIPKNPLNYIIWKRIQVNRGTFQKATLKSLLTLRIILKQRESLRSTGTDSNLNPAVVISIFP